jgi:hypothetical protein
MPIFNEIIDALEAAWILGCRAYVLEFKRMFLKLKR